MIQPALFAALCTNAKIHHHLDTLAEQQDDMLFAIERKEILAYNDAVKYKKLEELKNEVRAIRFTDLSP
ncbi:MAG: hypothetical protein OXR66_01890 [Candidatus Woesearchaeota archaeon]|nr:hypothetical protein [Candidatus Woesearchaeota archaeon]